MESQINLLTSSKNLYHNSSYYVKIDSKATNFFNINTVVRQGCILLPFLFLYTIDFCYAENNEWTKHWNKHTRLTDLNFADDIALLSEMRASLQDITTNLYTETIKVGLYTNANKTKVMLIGSHLANTLITTG